MMQSDTFYKARDAVLSDTYKKEGIRKLKKYIVWLKSVKIDDSHHSSWQARSFVSGLIEKISTEINHRRAVRKKLILTISAGVLATVIGGVILHFIFTDHPSQNTADKQYTNQKTQQVQEKAQSRVYSAPSKSVQQRTRSK